MQRTLFCTVMWVLTGALWAGGFLVASLKLQGHDVPWWLVLMREPLSSALFAALTVTLVVWHLLAPMGLVWKLAYRAGRQAAAVDAQEAQARGNVVPLQRQPQRT